MVYLDPEFLATGKYKRESDIYSFGVVLFEVLSGRVAYDLVYCNENDLGLAPIARRRFNEGTLKELIDPRIIEDADDYNFSLSKEPDQDSFHTFSKIAYQCLAESQFRRPTIKVVINELQKALKLQKELSKFADEDTSSNNLKIPLREIRRATNDFSKGFVGSGGYANVYRAELEFFDVGDLSSMERKGKDEVPKKISKTVAIKRINKRAGEKAEQGFLTEIKLLTSCKHPNIVSLLGFCREAGEMILVYEYAFKGSLSTYLVSTSILTWAQRLRICLNIAHGINFLHTDMEERPRIIHRDIKSDNILLDENLNAKVADFGLSKIHLMSQQLSTIYTKNIAGTEVYLDPEYKATGKYKRESDIYSFGVVLFEVLSGRVAYDSFYTNENDLGLAPIARRRFNEGRLKELIDPRIIVDDDDCNFTLNRGPNQDSFHTFSKIAYQCLAETQVKRPKIKVVINELQNALKLQGETVVLSRSRLSDIVLATQNFAETYRIGLDTTGTVYKAELQIFGNNAIVDIKRITCKEGGERKQEFFDVIEMHACKHPNIVPLIGFCDEGDEMIVVYEHVSDTSLDHYLKSVDNMDNFTWSRRIRMCLEIARGIHHLHTKMINGSIIRSDIKSANILLDKKDVAKIAYFVISKLRTTNQEINMKVYEDPEYETTDKLERESDIYSFGVVLFEIFCGTVAYDPIYIKENDKGLAPIACQCYDDNTIERIIDPKIRDIYCSNREGDTYSLGMFLKLAYRCLGIAAKRPTMEMVIMELETSLNLHESEGV